MKRFFDIIVSLISLLVFFPLFIILACAVKYQDGGPIFFRQKRVGKHGSIFWIFKFRSMVVDADRFGNYFTIEGDPRITPFGSFIRRTSLDELPQLFNVLMGDMSIVGPRPDVPMQKSLYTDSDWMLRNSIRPGITGLAQATLRSEATQFQRLELDLQYVKKSSVIYDFIIIIMTIKQVIIKKGV